MVCADLAGTPAQEKVQLNQLVDELQAGEPTKSTSFWLHQKGFPEAARKFFTGHPPHPGLPAFLLQPGPMIRWCPTWNRWNLIRRSP